MVKSCNVFFIELFLLFSRGILIFSLELNLGFKTSAYLPHTAHMIKK